VTVLKEYPEYPAVPCRGDSAVAYFIPADLGFVIPSDAAIGCGIGYSLSLSHSLGNLDCVTGRAGPVSLANRLAPMSLPRL